MSGEVSYLEVGAGQAKQTGEFFARLFGWRFNPMGNDGEGWFAAQRIKIGLHGNEPDPKIEVYFQVPDLDAAIALVRQLGGEADTSGAVEPGFGRFCSCRGPQGIRFGLHQTD